MDVHELLRLPQTAHDKTAARADNLREQIKRPTADLAETEDRLAELAATRRVINGSPLPTTQRPPRRPSPPPSTSAS
ncbi:hypothetical protein [Streptomyces achromogenes]|uniref:hypothetical protein n=1 Tax=Streptomyces achromogenes TaxID=67255 RepID=UPI0036F95E5E